MPDGPVTGGNSMQEQLPGVLLYNFRYIMCSPT
jgi:hypothetical protein